MTRTADEQMAWEAGEDRPCPTCGKWECPAELDGIEHCEFCGHPEWECGCNPDDHRDGIVPVPGLIFDDLPLWPGGPLASQVLAGGDAA